MVHTDDFSEPTKKLAQLQLFGLLLLLLLARMNRLLVLPFLTATAIAGVRTVSSRITVTRIMIRITVRVQQQQQQHRRSASWALPPKIPPTQATPPADNHRLPPKMIRRSVPS